MDRRLFLTSAAAGALGPLWPAPAFAADDDKDLTRRVDEAVGRGLEYLKQAQLADGHWEAPGGNYPTTMTALAGMCFLMEGSTLREGKYSDQIDKAVRWFLAPGRQQPSGLIGNSANPFEAARYMYGHGFGMLFLACVYGEEEDADRRRQLESALTRGVVFTANAQTSKKHRKRNDKGEVAEVEIGGWGYVSAKDNPHFDEGSVTITQMQALRAARNAGIPVPKETITRAVDYLEACTTSRGGVVYQYLGGPAAAGTERTPITAAAVCCGFSAGEYDGKLPKVWLKFCRDNIPVARGRVPHEEYQNYYFSQAVYALGDDRFGKLFPDEPKEKWLTWSAYRAAVFPYLLDTQDKATGAWQAGGTYGIGPIYVTTVNLSILLLEKGVLPIYHR